MNKVKVHLGSLAVLTVTPFCVRPLSGWATKRDLPQALGHQGPGPPDVSGRHQEVPSPSLVLGQGNRVSGVLALLSALVLQTLFPQTLSSGEGKPQVQAVGFFPGCLFTKQEEDPT